MFAQLTLAAALFAQGAPIPKDTAPSGPAPKVIDLKADANGKFMMTVIRQEKRKLNVASAIAPAPGAPVVLSQLYKNANTPQTWLQRLKSKTSRN